MRVEPESSSVVFEVRRAGKSRTQDVVLHVHDIADVARLQVRPQPIAPAGAFRFEAGEPVAERYSSDPSEPVRVWVPVTCRGGEEGREDETILTLVLDYPNQEPCTLSMRLIASANYVLPLWRVLAEECTEIKQGWRDEIHSNKVLMEPAETDRRRLQEMLGIVHKRSSQGDGLMALCLSGRSIRTSPFNLGTLQGLMAFRLLDKFDYISSVACGGFLSGWLSGWMHRSGGANEVAAEFAQAELDAAPQPEPLHLLRHHSNQLTSHLGALSGDTWTIVTMLLGNLLLKIIVLFPLAAAVLLVPLLAVATIPESWAPKAGTLFLLALVLGMIGLFFMSLLRASTKPQAGRSSIESWDQRFFLLALFPFLIANVFLAWAVAEYENQSDLTFPVALRIGALWALVTPMVAFVLAALLQNRILGRKRGFFMGDLVSLVLSGTIITLLYPVVLVNWGKPLLSSPYPLYPVFAALIFLGLFFLQIVLFIGSSSFWEERGYPRQLADAEREWWARWAGYILLATLSWTVVSAAVFASPTLLFLTKSRIAALGTSGILGWIIARLRNFGQPSGDQSKWRSWTLTIATALYQLALLLLVSALTQDFLKSVFAIKDSSKGWVQPFQGTIDQVLAALLVFGSISVMLGLLFSVNHFSVLNIYRSRLVRAYLGASNPRRYPNSFTGYEPDDDLLIHDLRANRLFPLVNASYFLAADRYREVNSFTMTPLHCGSARLGYRRSQAYGGEQGMTLGTAMATSGATTILSVELPSSPLIKLILERFLRQVGVWLGNPGPMGAHTHDRSGPRYFPLVSLSELLGRVDPYLPYVKLSDGGHFESLGIFEVVRRRCRLIVAFDSDSGATFDALQQARRKIYRDLGIPIEFGEELDTPSKPSDPLAADPFRCLLGRIRYSAVDRFDAMDGTLIYLKPVTRESQGTAGPWFDEEQFEDYRSLGRKAIHRILGNRPIHSLNELEARVRSYLQPPP